MNNNQPQINGRSMALHRKFIDAPTLEDLLRFEPTTQALAGSIIETLDLTNSNQTDFARRGRWGRHISQEFRLKNRHNKKQFSTDIEQSRGYGLTIGIYGEWGSGKTSFLKMVAKHINEQSLSEKARMRLKDGQISEKEKKKLMEQGISPIWFDAWKYDREDNLWASLLQTILNRVSDRSIWHQRVWVKLRIWRKNLKFRNGMWEVLKKVLSFIFRLLLIAVSIYILFGLGSTAAGTSLTTLLKNTQIPLGIVDPFKVFIAVLIVTVIADPFKWFTFLKGEINIDFTKFENKSKFIEHIAFMDEFIKEFLQIIRLLDQKPLVVIIDDLDRCLPEKAIQILEAIKVFWISINAYFYWHSIEK